MTRSSVDLPPPLGPSSAVSDPGRMSTDTSRSTGVPPKLLVTSRTSIAIGPSLAAEQFGQQEGHDRQQRQRGRGGEGGRLVEVLEPLLDEQGQRLGLADQP